MLGQSIILLSLIVHGLSVFIEDAFTKNWAQYNHGNLQKYAAISPSSFVGLSSTDLVGYQLSDVAKLSWKVTVPEGSDIVVNGHSVVSYSISGDSVNVWDADTGVLHAVYDITAKTVEPSQSGFMVLSTNGTVLFVDANESRLIADAVNDMVVSQKDHITYIVTDASQLITVSDSVTITAMTAKFNKISHVKSNNLLANGQVYNLDSNLVVHKGKVSQVLGDDFSYSLENGKFKLYKQDEVVLEDDFGSVKVLEDYLIVDEPQERRIIDLKQFYVTLDESSINLESYVLTPGGKDYLFDNFVYSLEVIDKSVKVSTYDLIKDEVSTMQYELNTYNLSFPKALLINKPESKQTVDSIQHLIDEVQNNPFFLRWIKRTRRHLVEFGRFVVSTVLRLNLGADHIEITNPYNIEKLLVYVDGTNLVADDSLNGEKVWSVPIQPGLVDMSDNEDMIILEYPDKLILLSTRDGSTVEEAEFLEEKEPSSIYIQQLENTLQAYQVVDGELVDTWKFSRGDILSFSVKPDTRTGSVGITLHDKSVLYKYLNGNSLTVITFENNTLKVYVLDGKTGAIVYFQEHSADEVVDNTSINLIMDDNWIIYSYFVTKPTPQQRVTVIDLFGSKPETPFNNTITSSSTKSFIYPEKIVGMESSYTKFGVTLKTIVFLTEHGDLIDMPKFFLNSRRIDTRPLTANDMKDDFKMLPYEPILARNTYQVLNHQHKLEADDKNILLIKDTKLESTSVICLINSHNKFCTRLQPSLGFDILNENFQSVQLILTIIMVLGAYLFTKPMVLKKELNNQWVYTT